MDAILLPIPLTIIKILGILNLTHWKLSEITLLTFPQRIMPLKRSTGPQTSVMVQRDISPNDILEKLAKEAQELASEKEKQVWKFNNCWFNVKRKLRFGPTNSPVLLKTVKFPLLTTTQALHHWSTDKMIALMNEYWWGNINKVVVTTSLIPFV